MAQKEPNYWLMKSEPDVYGINHLEDEKETLWDGIRNYQARNYMREMNIGDQAFFYHSNCKPPGIVGMMEVTNTGIVDPTQFDKDSRYFDPKSATDNPRWDCVKLKYLKTFKEKITLSSLTERYSPEEFKLVRKGNRLSIIPVSKQIAKQLFNEIKDFI